MSVAQLHFVICNAFGVPYANGELLEHESGEVVIPIDDIRTAQGTIDIYDPRGALFKPALARIVKAYYTPTKNAHPIFAGPLLVPTYDGDGETAAFSAVGVEWRLQRAYLATPLTVAARDVGQAMADLIGRAANRAYPVGSPGLGIDIGTIQATFNINRTWDAGQNIWDAISELSQLQGAPDIEFAPVDLTNGTLAVFNAWAPPMGTDRSAVGANRVLFEYGTGLDNCADFQHEPSGENVHTTYTAVGQPPDDGSLTSPSYTAHHAAQEHDIGIYEGWDSNDADNVAVLTAEAKMDVGAYHLPPDFITVTPQYEGSGKQAAGSPPRWDVDYGMGDVVAARALKGTLDTGVIDGRVRQVTVGEEDASSSAPEVMVKLEIAPNVDMSGVT